MIARVLCATALLLGLAACQPARKGPYESGLPVDHLALTEPGGAGAVRP